MAERITLRAYRILSGERRRMTVTSGRLETPPVMLSRLQAAGLIANVRKAGRWWVWEVTERGRALAKGDQL